MKMRRLKTGVVSCQALAVQSLTTATWESMCAYATDLQGVYNTKVASNQLAKQHLAVSVLQNFIR